jgi:hypothetical protein
MDMEMGTLSWIAGWDLNLITCVLMSRRHRKICQTQRPGEVRAQRFEDTGLENWSNVSTRQKILQSSEVRRGKEQAFSQILPISVYASC